MEVFFCFFFFSSRRRHTRYIGDWSSDVCSSDLPPLRRLRARRTRPRAGTARPSGGRTSTDICSAARKPARRGGRSEERRVGKECRCGWSREHCKRKSRERGEVVSDASRVELKQH